MQNEILIIERFSNNTRWTAIFVSFFSVFGGIWLLLEPLGLFKVGDTFFQRLGLNGYIILIGISISISIFLPMAYEIYKKMLYVKKLELVYFSIIVISTGKRYNIKTPKHLRIIDFLNYFFDYLEKAESLTELKFFNKYFNKYLHVKKNDTFKRVEGAKSLTEVGITDGDECRIEAEQTAHSKIYSFISIPAEILISIYNIIMQYIYAKVFK